MNPQDTTYGAALGFAACIAVGFALDYAARRIHRYWTRARHVLDNVPAVIRLDDYKKSNVVKLPAPRVGGQR